MSGPPLDTWFSFAPLDIIALLLPRSVIGLPKYKMADNNNDAAADQGEEAMNNDDDNVTVAVTKIAALPTDNPRKKRFSITFDNFEGLPSEIGHEVQSSIFSCFQTDWCVEIYPGGDEEEEDDEKEEDEEDYGEDEEDYDEEE